MLSLSNFGSAHSDSNAECLLQRYGSILSSICVVGYRSIVSIHSCYFRYEFSTYCSKYDCDLVLTCFMWNNESQTSFVACFIGLVHIAGLG